MRWCLLALACAACGAKPFAIEPPAAPPRQTRIDLSISGFRVSDGMRVVFVPDRKAREVQVTMRYRVGGIDDPPGQEGMAHLVEHLMFQEVANGESVFARLEGIATFWNGFTDHDTTTYVERALPARLPDLLDVEATRLEVPCSSISEDVFEREREVVINELAQHGDLEAIVDGLLYPEGHPYHRSVIGTEASLRSITRQQACAFANHHYGPEAAVLVVSGDVTEAELKQALTQMVAALPDHAVDPPLPVPRLLARGQRTKRSAPIPERAVLLAWPLPSDPATRAIVSAMAELLGTLLDVDGASPAVAMTLGGDRAPLLVLAIELARDQTVEAALENVRTASSELHGAFAAKVFEHARQRATHALFAKFEDGVARDLILARHVEAGREAGDGFSREVRAIAEVTYRMAQQLAADALDVDEATVIELEPSGPVARTTLANLALSIHDAGQPRLDVDPADAHRPARFGGAPDPLRGALTRKLPNGLSVVLLPMSSVPAIEMRLVFATGSADDPPGERGLARLAAHSLDLGFTRNDVSSLLAFYEAGGDFSVHVERDRTTYDVDGIDMYLDYLLTGLARMARTGSADAVTRALVTASGDHAAARPDPWRAALYGPDHPYAAAAGIDARAMDATSVLAFRAQHFTPDNATLVIAGGFDPAVANAWIDYLFAAWTGHASPRASPRAAVQATSLARVTTGAQVGLEIVMQARPDAASRAAQLVIAEMASELVADIRHQLGASYGVYAHLIESRLSTRYEIDGDIEASRAVEAVGMIRDRLAQLRTGSDDIARVFVRARARVVARLGAYASGSRSLAERVEHAIELGRDLHADAATQGAVRALTIDRLAGLIDDLDLGRAAIRASGPRDVVTALYGALGRTPTFVEN